jgi:hypothetical protein
LSQKSFTKKAWEGLKVSVLNSSPRTASKQEMKERRAGGRKEGNKSSHK